LTRGLEQLESPKIKGAPAWGSKKESRKREGRDVVEAE